MFNNLATMTAFRFYNLAWSLALPLLRMNRRLSAGFQQRLFRSDTPAPADLWIQAASVGEAYLAWEILKQLRPPQAVRILLTTNTRQGLGILKQAITDITPNDQGIIAESAYFPFDKPAIMKTAVNTVDPKVMVLLETELWPGLLFALKERGSKIIIANARMTVKSLGRYRICPLLWHSLEPDKILAVSDEDNRRYSTIFSGTRIDVVPNIKFDRIGPASLNSDTHRFLQKIIPPEAPFLVLGSVRQAEESPVENMILKIFKQHPETLIGLFPRHAERVPVWCEMLNRRNIPWRLRSQAGTDTPGGTVMIWDKFGELTAAYALAKAAFVGGSLAPLGGQNFLEALTCGVIPVIGPSWENFKWIGREIIDRGLVRETADWNHAAEALLEHLKNPPERNKIRKTALAYIKRHQGGTAAVCQVITNFLNTKKENPRSNRI